MYVSKVAPQYIYYNTSTSYFKRNYKIDGDGLKYLVLLMNQSLV